MSLRRRFGRGEWAVAFSLLLGCAFAASCAQPAAPGQAPSRPDPGEFHIPPTPWLGVEARTVLRERITHNQEYAAIAEALQNQARPWLSAAPRPIAVIHYEGLLNTDPRRIESVRHLSQMGEAATVLRYWQATEDPEAARALHSWIYAWAVTYRPTGNDVNENKLFPLLVAYASLRNAFEPAAQAEVDAWAEQLGELHAQGVVEAGQTDNRFVKRVRLLACVALILDRPDWRHACRGAIQRYVSEGLRANGESLDLRQRDSLSYHGSGLKSAMEAAVLLGDVGRDLYAWRSADGASIQGSVRYVFPYAVGEKTHREWVGTTVELDRRRAEAGIAQYQPGRAYDSRRAIPLFEWAAWFDLRARAVAGRLLQAETGRGKSWVLLCAEASGARPTK
ncbi:MAG: alginate lyase family protein [Planctomycetota bacterium]